MNAMKITQLLGELQDNYCFTLADAEQGAYEDSVLLRDDTERLEIVLRFEDGSFEIVYTSEESDTVIKVEGDLIDLIENVDNVTEAVSTLGV